MKKFEKGVSFYTTATLKINFPEANICCQLCPLLRVESRTERRYCGMTGELLLYPEHQWGASCPLDFGGEEETGDG